MFVVPNLLLSSVAGVTLCGQLCSVHLWVECSFSIVVTARIPWGSAYPLPRRV